MDTQREDLVNKISSIFKTEKRIEVGDFIIAIFLRVVFEVPFHNGVFLVIVGLFLQSFIFDYFLKKQKTLEDAELICFFYWFFNTSVIGFVFYSIGSIWWIGIIIFVLPILNSNILLSRKKGLFLAIYAFFCYAGFALLEFFGVIPHQQFFLLSEDLYHNPFYLISTLITGLILFPYIAFVTSSSAQVLRERTEELERTYEKLGQVKSTLEVKVQARTKELEQLNKELEQKVGERTKELEVRLEDLEKFQKLSVAREMRMIELKEELEKLKGKNKE